MFESVIETIEPDRVTQYRITKNGVILTYSNVIELWQSDQSFRDYFTAQLNDSPYSGFRWETPAITDTTVGRPFEFVLINSPGFAVRNSDPEAFAPYFTDNDVNCGIVTFSNLQGDATLVVPSPRTTDRAYGHLAAFLRNAPSSQVHSIWRIISTEIQTQLGANPLWLSTAGGGVAWLHIRLDAQPKYYGHVPYKTA